MAALQSGLDATNAALTQLKAHFESVLPKFTVYDASQQELAAWRATVEGMLTTQKNEQEDLMSTQAKTIVDLQKLYDVAFKSISDINTKKMVVHEI